MRNYNDLQVLPCGIQDFEKIRTGNYLYIDKTDFVYQLASDMAGECFFLGRPRRFGKSLFLSTLDYYYQGRKDLFKGLKIMELEKEWKQYEVLRFDLSGCATVEELKSTVRSKIVGYEKKYNIPHDETFALKDRFATIIIEAYQQSGQRVVLLFDEYDSALQSTLFYDEEHEKMRTFYRSFFAPLKSESKYLHKIFLTGIMKFTQLSLFSVLNNIRIISASNIYAGVCGFTHEELRNDFKPYVERLAEVNNVSLEDAYSQIIERYDGYCFSECMTKVINPFSLLNSLEENKLGSYWSYSGANKYIMDSIDNSEEESIDLENASVEKEKLEMSDADKDDIILSLYQTGYLTIKKCENDFNSYILAVPNKEVKDAINKLIVPRILDKDKKKIDSVVGKMKRLFAVGDLDAFMQNIQSLVAGTPYSQDHTAKAIEDRFQFILTTILHFCGLNPLPEVRTATGRIDILCKTKWRNAIFELKMKSNGGLESASEQIEERQYALPFLSDNKELSTIAVEFDAEQKLLTRWEIKRVK